MFCMSVLGLDRVRVTTIGPKPPSFSSLLRKCAHVFIVSFLLGHKSLSLLVADLTIAWVGTLSLQYGTVVRSILVCRCWCYGHDGGAMHHNICKVSVTTIQVVLLVHRR
jgi:hypothetical protein